MSHHRYASSLLQSQATSSPAHFLSQNQDRFGYSSKGRWSVRMQQIDIEKEKCGERRMASSFTSQDCCEHLSQGRFEDTAERKLTSTVHGRESPSLQQAHR